MDLEKKRLYFQMVIGNMGVLLLGLAMLRYLSEFHDSLGQGLVLFGLIFVLIYMRFLEDKAGVTRKESNLSKIILVTIFLIAPFLL
ncbi:hypothetical protein [Virgibacillus litoralis]|uniref:Uncharacterized protein n=1 Tax=Virgibacillus litoralis TaxID=578221 RepID=A0ABS4HFB6_9BACI|nr:hypothetical protein [Virgibacillus litoralis]MBP1949630.1 hypothetical protein [Virgibacillus litoralis]